MLNGIPESKKKNKAGKQQTKTSTGKTRIK